MFHPDLPERREQFCCHVRRTATAVGCVVERTRTRPRERDQLLHRPHRQRRMHRQQQRCGREQAHRREVAHRVVGQPAAERGVDPVRRDTGEEQRVAVGWRACGEVGADRAARARPVVDHHRLADRLGQPLADRARDRVVAAAWRKGDDPADRLRRPGLGGSRRCRHADEQHGASKAQGAGSGGSRGSGGSQGEGIRAHQSFPPDPSARSARRPPYSAAGAAVVSARR